MSFVASKRNQANIFGGLSKSFITKQCTLGIGVRVCAGFQYENKTGKCKLSTETPEFQAATNNEEIVSGIIDSSDCAKVFKIAKLHKSIQYELTEFALMSIVFSKHVCTYSYLTNI